MSDLKLWPLLWVFWYHGIVLIINKWRVLDGRGKSFSISLTNLTRLLLGLVHNQSNQYGWGRLHAPGDLARCVQCKFSFALQSLSCVHLMGVGGWGMLRTDGSLLPISCTWFAKSSRQTANFRQILDLEGDHVAGTRSGETAQQFVGLRENHGRVNVSTHPPPRWT